MHKCTVLVAFEICPNRHLYARALECTVGYSAGQGIFLIGRWLRELYALKE